MTPLSTSGRFIVDAHGRRVRLAGVNWYGASEDLGVPAGLDRANRNTLAGLIAAQGFNDRWPAAKFTAAWQNITRIAPHP